MAAPKGNKYALGNTWGRPPDYKNAEELAAKILDYIEYCEGDYHEEETPVLDKKGDPTGKTTKITICDREPESLTITGLCLFLGFDSRMSFDNQAKRGEEFLYIVKRAKMLVENRYEKGLSGNNPTGPIFALKNMGWKDKTEVESNNKHQHTGLTMVFQQSPGCDPLTPPDADPED